MTIAFNVSLRNSMLQEMADAVDGGVGAGFLRIYNGTRPATGGAVTTLLAELTFTDPSFLAPSGGAIAADSIADETSAPNTGTATWFRVVDSAGAFVIDGDVGVSGSDLNLSSISIGVGQAVSVNSFDVTAGNP